MSWPAETRLILGKNLRGKHDKQDASSELTTNGKECKFCHNWSLVSCRSVIVIFDVQFHSKITMSPEQYLDFLVLHNVSASQRSYVILVSRFYILHYTSLEAV